jgi:hypothetical protein
VKNLPVFTYQTRLDLAPGQEKVLDAFAELFGRVERSLFAALQIGKSITDIKREFLGKFGITARQFNAIAAGLKGKIVSVKERRPGLIQEAKERIRKAKKIIGKLEKRSPGSEKLHQKKRRLHLLEQRLEAMQADQESGIVRICFGSRKLFRAQLALEEKDIKTSKCGGLTGKPKDAVSSFCWGRKTKPRETRRVRRFLKKTDR